MKRYYVTVQFAVQASSADAAELMVARRIQGMLAREGRHARVVVEAEASTDEALLQVGAPMLTEE